MKSLVSALFRNSSRTLFTIFVATLLVRGGFILTLQDGFYFPDSVAYSKAAMNLLSHGELGESYKRPPGYPVFLAGIYLFFGESIFAVRTIESLIGALLAIVIALIGRRIGGDTVGALAGLLWSIYPLGVFIAGLVYPTGLVTTLLASGILCILSGSQPELSRKRAFLAGILLGLATLTVPVVIATISVIGLWLLYRRPVNRLRLVSLFFLGAALVILPWAIRDFYVYGRVVLVEPRVVEHLPRMRSADAELRQRKVEAILSHPSEYAFRIARHLSYFWKLYPDRITMDKPGFREQWHEKHPRVVQNTIFTTNDLVTVISILSTGPLFVFAILGTAAMWLERERRRELALLWGTILSFAAMYSLFYAKTRYRIPIEPYITILSAYGIKKTWDLLAARFARDEAAAQFGNVRGSKLEV